MLHALGYKVLQETSQTRFAEEHAEDILLGFRTKPGKGPRSRAQSNALGAARLSVLMPRQDIPVMTDHTHTGEAGSALAARAAANGLTITSISSSSVDAADLLRVAQPLASHLAERATVNELGVASVDAEEGCWVLPIDATKWPRNFVSDDGEIQAVGTLFFTKTPRLAPVGWFDDRAVGLAEARSRVPLLVVERTDRDGQTRTTRVLRRADGLGHCFDTRGRGTPP